MKPFQRLIRLVRTMGRVFIIGIRGFDASHCVNAAMRDEPAVQQLVQQLANGFAHHAAVIAPSFFEVAVAFRVLMLCAITIDVLCHAYKTARKILDDEERDKK